MKAADAGMPYRESCANSNLEWAKRTGASSANIATGQIESPAGADATMAGVDVAIGVKSGSVAVATTGAIMRSRGWSVW